MAIFGNHIPQKSRVDADAQVKTGAGKLCALVVVGGSAATSIALYDNTSATGDPIFEAAAPANDVSPLISLADVNGIDFSVGLYADITTTGGSVFIWYA